MNRMHKTRLHIIRLFALLLLLAGGVNNEAWAKTVTYHILTLPFDVRNHNDTGPYKTNIRVEALQCTSEEATVGLPDRFVSPLAKNFRYWKTATSTYTHLYDYANNNNLIEAKYYIYQCEAAAGDDAYSCLSNEITVGTSIDDAGDPSDIYVTYEYDDANTILQLDGVTEYNVSVNVNNKQRFMCYNRSRNNRVANALSTGLSGEDLASADFVTPDNNSSQLGWKWATWGPIGVHMGFKFVGTDPYNIVITTSYAGEELHITDAITGVDGTGTIKPYAGATLFGKIGTNKIWFDCSNNKHYRLTSGIKSAGQWTEAKYAECKKKYKDAASDAERFDTWVGFYRKEFPTINAYALLTHPNGEYVFVGSKMNQGNKSSTNPTINQPNGSNQYATYDDNNNDPYFKFQAFSNAHKMNFYRIRTYTLKLKTHGSNTVLTKEIRWSDARATEKIIDHVPDELRRKYVKFTGAYEEKEVAGVKQADTSKPISTFADAVSACTSVIWIDYETDTEAAPFEFLPEGGSYTNAHWYTIRVNGKAEQKNIAYNSSNDFITGSTSIGSESDLHHGENSADAMVAFMGDPYELKIICRATSETATTNRYIGCATGAADGTTLNTNKTGSSDISTWEIMYESTDAGNFVLRQFTTVSSPKYIGWSTTSTKPVIYSTTATRIRVVDLNKVNYTYHIMRSDGTKAIKATVNHYVGKPLTSWTDIPTIIRSPFLAPDKTATVTYYDNPTDATNRTNAITNAPYNYSINHDIYVRYSFVTPPSGSDYNVTLNAEYIYTSTTLDDDNIYSKENITTGEGSEAEASAYQWFLSYSDPYAMKIKNKGKSKYIKIASPLTNNTALDWDTEANATLFIIKQSADNPGYYEVMVATGDTYDAGDGPGITTTYFNIGRNISSTTNNTVKLFQNTTYASGYNQLRFRLIGATATEITYHLIDKANTDLLRLTWRHTNTDLAYFPPRYRSPLVSAYHYYPTKKDAEDGTNPIVAVGENSNIYVTYDVNDLIDLKRGKLYLLKFENGDSFNQENGSDGRLSDSELADENKSKAVYPYCNGDCNFNIYGQYQYDLQQEGAASTRTRWAWYVQSDIEGAPKGDPYHVKIRSRQSESYPITNSSEYNAYFATYMPDGYTKVVTTLTWPGITGVPATEYMVLGNEGQYQLVTTNEISGSRYTVNSFEQYWKTWDTIRKKIYGESSAKENDSDPIIIPNDTKYPYESPTAETLRHYLENTLKWHSYENWAYAKRWNGYNNGYSSEEGTHEKKKGWEKIEHWYQTVNMGEGYFDFVETSINPVLILLDQHGWEIMRKPIPTSPTDPQKDAKFEAIRPYNSPMVKEYAFWATAKKRTGFHQYYLMSDRMGGNDYTSTDLTDLPPYDSKNVHDKKGNLNDQYVTYIVKDEYAQTYQPGETPTAKPFLIEQGSKYASTSDGTTITENNVSSVGSMKKHITNDEISDEEKWYVKPNSNIDYEMGYGDTGHDWDAKTPNAYEDAKYKDNKIAIYIDQTDEYKNADDDGKKAIKDKYGFFSFSNGFDPYNIQISSVKEPSKYMKTDANGATLHEGSFVGSYTAVPGTIGMGANTTSFSPKWYDSRNLSVTNATFMAVQDADGNMQLMPRFDHDRRMSEFGTLIAPTDANAATTTPTKLYRPVVYHYRFIDNNNNESIRYKSGGDLLPQTPDRFKSPFATNLTYYTDDACTNEITASLDGVTLTDSKVYVRYEYDEEADDQKILMGNWQTMKLNGKDVQYTTVSSTAGIYYGVATSESKPSPVDGYEKKWQWKFLESPQSEPDPYAVKIYSRNKSDGAVISTTYALLPHVVDGASDGYMLTYMNGTSGYTYNTLMGGATDAAAAENNDGNSTYIANGTNNYDAKCKILLTNDVEYTFIYKVYTNSGKFAISANQTQEDIYTHDWTPRIPDGIKTPLLNLDQFRYYSKDNVTFGTGDPVPITDIVSIETSKNLSHLYGLYDDEVIVRYTSYDPSVTEYQVPNVRNATGGTVAKGNGSNDAPLDLSQTLLYNVIWHNDNMMCTTSRTDVVGHANQAIKSDNKYEWKISGNDPYAMTFYNVDAEKYITAASAANDAACSLTDNPTTFMLLPKSDYDYGMLAITGNKDSKLTIPDDRNTETKEAAKITTGDPAKFIIFALATHRVIYHLMIKNIGEDIIVPYKGAETGGELNVSYKIGTGTTKRDLTTKGEGVGHIDGDYYQLGGTLKAIGTRASGNGESINTSTGLYSNDLTYCYDAGHVSLGDEFEVPDVFYRPNVDYRFIVAGVYDATGANEIAAMNTKYKGVMTKCMGDDPGLLLNTVFVNIVYSFADLTTNSGEDFVTNVSQNKWYSFETNDATPQLAQYTTLEGLKTESGYATHYTNDYLWTPVGDPYGFKMYNRYAHKNLEQTTKVMTTASIGNNIPVTMDNEASNGGRDIYELMATSTTTTGYFRVHPMQNRSGETQYYMYNDGGTLKLSTVPTEWTFGISEDLMKPYYQGAGYVGGLNAAGKAAYETAAAKENEFEKLTSIQKVVYNHDNNNPEDDPTNPNYIVHYAPGYYRLHSQPGSDGITTPRYASGYTHKIELTAGAGSTAIPLHFYEQTSYSVNNPDFTDLESGEYTITNATRGDIPLVTVDKDPASIFYFPDEEIDHDNDPVTAMVPGSKIITQGLYVKENKMTDTEGNATSFNIIDIGGAIVIMYSGSPANYLSYDQSTAKYDIKYGSDVPASTARWCMQPVQKGTTAGSGEMPLKLTGNNGQDKHFYTTFCAPFDVLLTDAENDKAYVVPTGKWSTEILYPKEIGEYNTGTYAGNSQFIPAGTPVIIRSKNSSTSSTSTINLALPTTIPTSAVSCVFSEKYLEQELTQSYDYNSDHSIDYVYVFGLEYSGTYVENPSFATNGLITATTPSPTKTLGFFKNMNHDRESSEYKNSWTRNNKYVYANKIYYRNDPIGSSARELDMESPTFVPVIFDYEEEEGKELEPDGSQQQIEGDGCMYDLLGRKVATREQVEDGSWRYRVAPGVYIVNGKKIRR